MGSNEMKMASESYSESFNNASGFMESELVSSLRLSYLLLPAEIGLESNSVNEVSTPASHFCDVLAWS